MSHLNNPSGPPREWKLSFDGDLNVTFHHMDYRVMPWEEIIVVDKRAYDALAKELAEVKASNHANGFYGRLAARNSQKADEWREMAAKLATFIKEMPKRSTPSCLHEYEAFIKRGEK